MGFDFKQLRSLSNNSESIPETAAEPKRVVYDPGNDLHHMVETANLEKAAAAKKRSEISNEVIALKNMLRVPDKDTKLIQDIALISLRIASKALNDEDLYNCSKDSLNVNNEELERVLKTYSPVADPVISLNVSKPPLKIMLRKKANETNVEFEKRKLDILNIAEAKRDYILLHGITEAPDSARIAILTAVSLFNEKEPVYFGETLKTLLNEKLDGIDTVELLKDCVISGVETRTSYPSGSEAQEIYVDMITSKVFEKFPDLVIAARQKAYEMEDEV